MPVSMMFSGPTDELLERPDVLRSVFLEGAASALGIEAANGKRSSPGRTRAKKAAIPAPERQEPETAQGRLF